MSKKLTGREAVKAVMDGKKVFGARSNILGGVGLVYDDTKKKIIGTYKPNKIRDSDIYELHNVLAHDDWEIVNEPMVWETTMTIPRGSDGKITVPVDFQGKPIKVRIEEVIE